MSFFPDKLQKESSGVTSLIDVFEKNKRNAGNNINVATLGKIVSILQEYDSTQGFGKAIVSPFPVENAQYAELECTFFANYSFEIDETVYVIFADRDFRLVYQNGKWTRQAVKSIELHSTAYGIVFPFVTRATASVFPNTGVQNGDILYDLIVGSNAYELPMSSTLTITAATIAENHQFGVPYPTDNYSVKVTAVRYGTTSGVEMSRCECYLVRHNGTNSFSQFGANLVQYVTDIGGITLSVQCPTATKTTIYIEYIKDYSHHETCLLEGTRVLTDKGEVYIEDLKAGDMLAFWNSESGRNKIEYAKLILPPQEVATTEYAVYTFSDFSQVKMNGIHMLWSADKECLVRNVDIKPGDMFYNDKGEKVKFLQKKVVTSDKPLRSFNLFVRHRRYFANGIMCGHTNGALYEEYIRPENKQYRYKDSDGSYLRFLREEWERTEMYKNPQAYKVVADGTEAERIGLEDARKADALARQNLADSDYIVTKYAEGQIDTFTFNEWKVKREEWREIVRKFETEIPKLEEALHEKELSVIKSCKERNSYGVQQQNI